MSRKRFKQRKAPYRKPEDIPTPTSRKFDGKKYGLFDVFSSNMKLKSTKETLKRLKIKIRTVKLKNGKTALYSRK